MAFKLKPSDRKIQAAEKDPLELELELREKNGATSLKSEKKESEQTFNPWDYVRVVNLRGEPEFQAQTDEKVIVGHRGSGVLGNPFEMKERSLSERDRVIAEHKVYLKNDLETQGPVFKALRKIAMDIVENKQKIALECYCAPAECHLNALVPVIVDMAKEILEEQLPKKAELTQQNKKPKI